MVLGVYRGRDSNGIDIPSGNLLHLATVYNIYIWITSYIDVVMVYSHLYIIYIYIVYIVTIYICIEMAHSLDDL